MFKGQDKLGLSGENNPIKVSINQFYGIEINDFAVTVAKTALWIAESQMMKKTEDIIHMDLDFLPLKTYSNIVEDNALRINWEDVVSKDKLNYIMGNPPFVGTNYMSREQRKDMDTVLFDCKKRGKLDYVAAWYFKAAEMMSGFSKINAENNNTLAPCGNDNKNNINTLAPCGRGQGEGYKKATHFYSKQSLEYSKELRKNMTTAENILWFYLRNKQLNGLKFRRQEAFDKYILDFVCYEKKLVIELDGGGHLEIAQKEHDEERDNFIAQNGYKVLRIYNNDVLNNIEGVIDYIIANISDNTNTEINNPSRKSEIFTLPQGAGNNIKTALVSTNSITQGEQVAGVWKPLYERFGIHIDFAHRTFRWDSESNSKAHVHCVIVGFSCSENKNKKKLYSSERLQLVDNINAYLENAQNIFIESRNNPLSNIPPMFFGSMPRDGGGFILSEEEKQFIEKNEPIARKWIHKYVGAEEFINNKIRYCLWLKDINPSEIKKCKFVLNRVEKVKEFRLNSKAESTRKFADKPYLFCQIAQPNTEYLIVPSVSSERRKYIPIGFMNREIIANNLVQIIPNATLYEFGIMTSNVHMAWMRAVCGRLKSDYRYSNNIVYNNFPWCNPTDEQKSKIEKTAQGILDARALYPECSLADLYDELTMPPELRKAHQENDKAVMNAYGFKTKDETTDKLRWLTESETVASLMQMYQELTK